MNGLIRDANVLEEDIDDLLAESDNLIIAKVNGRLYRIDMEDNALPDVVQLGILYPEEHLLVIDYAKHLFQKKIASITDTQKSTLMLVKK
jgi:predicted transcriptional regulator